MSLGAIASSASLMAICRLTERISSRITTNTISKINMILRTGILSPHKDNMDFIRMYYNTDSGKRKKLFVKSIRVFDKEKPPLPFSGAEAVK